MLYSDSCEWLGGRRFRIETSPHVGSVHMLVFAQPCKYKHLILFIGFNRFGTNRNGHELVGVDIFGNGLVDIVQR